MQSLKELFKIGNGPSSSHTMGPKRAVEFFKNTYPYAKKFKVILYGSLALTGKGHLTDYIIYQTLQGYETDIEFNTEYECDVHPNTFDILAYDDRGEIIDKWRIYSVGGGTYIIDGKEKKYVDDIYKQNTWKEIYEYCENNNYDLYQYVCIVEGDSIHSFLKEVWESMKKTIKKGLSSEGVLYGKLNLDKRAKMLFEKKIENEDEVTKQNRLVSAYAYATSEENASGGTIVTAPTCGASGVLPAVLYYMQEKFNFDDEIIIKSLAVAGIIGNLVKTNATISGAECGCQAEIGTACSMAAAAATYLQNGNMKKIEYSAEIGMEHHLGLTCDPIYGYVQIPCIERNAIAAMRALEASSLALLLNERKISFDVVVETMYETGKDLQSHYRETSKGGLAKKYCRNKYYNIEMEE